MPQTRRSSRRSSSVLHHQVGDHLKEEQRDQKDTNDNSALSILKESNQINDTTLHNNDDDDDKSKEVGRGGTLKKKRTVSERSPAFNKSSRKKTAATTATKKTNKASTNSSNSSNNDDSNLNNPSTPTKKRSEENKNCDDKENQPLTPSVTPYWKIAEDRGGAFSPRETRSAKKSKRPCNIPRYSDMSPMPSSTSSSPKKKEKQLRSPSTTKKGQNNVSNVEESLQIVERDEVTTGVQKSVECKSNEEEDTIATTFSNSSKATSHNTTKSKAKESPSSSSSSYKPQFCLDFASPPPGVNNNSLLLLETSNKNNQKLKEEIMTLKKQVKTLQSNLDTQTKKNVDLEKEIMNLQARFEYQRDVKNLDMRLTKLSNDLNNQSAQQELVEIISGLREEKKEIQVKLDKVEKDHKKLLAENESCRNDKSRTSSSNMEKELIHLRNEILEQKQQREIVESKYHKVASDFESFHKEASELQTVVTTLRNENNTLKQNLQMELECNEKNKVKYEKSIESLKATFNQSQNEESNALISAQEEKIKVISQLEKIESELEMKNSTIFTMSDKETQLAQLNEELLRRCEDSEKEMEEVRAESKKLREAMSEKSSTMNELQQKVEESKVVYQEAAKMEDDLKKLQASIQEETDANGQLREQSVLLQQTLNETSEELEETKEQLSSQTKLCDDLDKKFVSATKDHEKKNEFIKNLQMSIVEQTKKNEDLTINIDELKDEITSNAEKYSAEKKELNEKIAELQQMWEESEKKRVDEQKNTELKLESISKELKEEKRMNEQMNEQLFHTMEQYENDKKLFRNQLAEKNNTIEGIQKRCKAMMKQMSTFNTRESALCEKILIQEEVRRSLHNRVMQLSGNIRVFVRVRPMISGEVSNSSSPYTYPTIYDRSKASAETNVSTNDDLTKRFIVATEPEKDRGGLSQRRKKWKFGFDNVFGPSLGQDSVWQATEPLVQSAIDGYNVCLFAYGQTGSGKTYTMLGTGANPGIITNSIKKLFDSKRTIEETSKGSTTVKISVELLEIYNEQVRDLLNENKGMSGYENINLSLSSSEAVGNIVFEALDEEHVMTVLQKAQKRRCVKATKSNAESSRSHLIFALNYTLQDGTDVERKSRLSICDLAGSERLSKSESYGEARKEAQHINKSLSSLSNVIEKLQQKSNHIPYRESKLTYLLQNSLGGDSKTLAIVCCNPLVDHFQETTCSLRFAQKLNKVELKALANVSC